jgi:hypothetical protein
MGTNRWGEGNRGRWNGAPGSPTGAHRDEPGQDLIRDPSLAPVVRALTAEPTGRELDGLAPALAALRARATNQPTRTRRRTMFATVVGVKLGATLGGVAAGLVGVGTVVLVSTHVPSAQLPAGIDGPAQPRPAAVSTTATAQGPDANGPAKHGLCTAWKARSGNPGSQGNADRSVAFGNLVRAAGGAGKVAAFCADVTAPGASGNRGGGNGAGKGNGHATAKPTKPRGGKPDKPGDEPADKDTGGPDGRPTGSASPTARQGSPTPTDVTTPTTTATTPPTMPGTTSATTAATTGTPVPPSSGTAEPSGAAGP